MGISCDSIEPFNQLIIAIPEIIQDEMVRALAYLGEQCTIRVRDRSGSESWFDQTGNLRSSIGYAVYEHGKSVIESAFDIVKNGSQGADKGRRMIQALASKYAETYALVVLAGMEYAEFVEAKDNKDVLASTELWARQKMKNYLDRAMEKAERRIIALQKQLGL